jgi:hypothetical protein
MSDAQLIMYLLSTEAGCDAVEKHQREHSQSVIAAYRDGTLDDTLRDMVDRFSREQETHS